MTKSYRTYLHTDYGYKGKGTHNLKRTIKLLDQLVYKEDIFSSDEYDYILLIIEDNQDIPEIFISKDEYEKFRREHYEDNIRNTSTKHKSLHRKN